MTQRYTVTMTFDCHNPTIAATFVNCIKQPSRIFGIAPEVKMTSKELPKCYDHDTLEEVKCAIS